MLDFTRDGASRGPKAINWTANAKRRPKSPCLQKLVDFQFGALNKSLFKPCIFRHRILTRKIMRYHIALPDFSIDPLFKEWKLKKKSSRRTFVNCFNVKSAVSRLCRCVEGTKFHWHPFGASSTDNHPCWCSILSYKLKDCNNFRKEHHCQICAYKSL